MIRPSFLRFTVQGYTLHGHKLRFLNQSELQRQFYHEVHEGHEGNS